MDDPSNKADKRGHPRVNRRFVIRFKFHYIENSNWAMPTLRNISRTGCYFYSDVLCEVGQMLDIKIQFPVFNEFMDFVGEVKRVDPQKVVRITECGVGVYFQKMDKEKKEKFIQVLSDSLKQQEDQ